MRHIVKNRRGFTLVEMMLSLAIISIIFGLTTALMVSINDSFTLTYNLNDSTDYAMLYGSAIENSVLSQISKKDKSSWECGTYSPSGGTESGDEQNSILMITSASSGTSPVFEPHQMKTKQNGTGAVVDKWRIEMYFNVSGSIVNYVVLVYDNYYNPTQPLMCKYEGSFWIPHSTASVSVDTTSSTNSLAGTGYYSKLIYS